VLNPSKHGGQGKGADALATGLGLASTLGSVGGGLASAIPKKKESLPGQLKKGSKSIKFKKKCKSGCRCKSCK